MVDDNTVAAAVDGLASAVGEAGETIGELFSATKAIEELAHQVHNVAEAITVTAVPGTDATGGCISSLTEAAMGITAGLVAIAEAVKELAGAVRDGYDV